MAAARGHDGDGRRHLRGGERQFGNALLGGHGGRTGARAGEFQLLDNQGRELTKFKVRKSYLGGAGIGGWDMLKTEDLVKQLGELVAETTDKWLRGEKIN